MAKSFRRKYSRYYGFTNWIEIADFVVPRNKYSIIILPQIILSNVFEYIE